jgi:hypothetical protein
MAGAIWNGFVVILQLRRRLLVAASASKPILPQIRILSSSAPSHFSESGKVRATDLRRSLDVFEDAARQTAIRQGE